MRSNHVMRAMFALALGVSFAACGGSSDTDDIAEPTVAPAAPVADEGEPDPAAEEPATEPSEPATQPSSVADEPDPATAEPTVTEPTVTEPPDEPAEPSVTDPPDETVSFDRNAPFRDEFDGALLGTAGWAWVGEDADAWRFEDGRLVLSGAERHVMGEPVNLLTRIVPDEMELSISTQVLAAPQENFEATGLMLMNDEGEYAAVVLGFCDLCLPDTTGVGIFGEAMSGEDNLLVEPAMFPYESSDPVRLTIDWSPGSEVVVGGYFAAGDEYRMVFRLDNAPVFTSFGLFAHDLPMGGENTVAMEGHFDWFELKVYEP